METYYAYTLDKAVDGQEGFMWCLTKGCNFVFAYSLEKEEGDDEIATDYECPKCMKVFCIKCKVDWHEDLTCEEYLEKFGKSEEDKQFDELVASKKYKRCPHCNFMVSKTIGCNNMACKCGKSFCYKCGQSNMHPARCQCMIPRRERME
jgi:hypothetical protein